jgi:hypothetical protein
VAEHKHMAPTPVSLAHKGQEAQSLTWRLTDAPAPGVSNHGRHLCKTITHRQSAVSRRSRLCCRAV